MANSEPKPDKTDKTAVETIASGVIPRPQLQFLPPSDPGEPPFSDEFLKEYEVLSFLGKGTMGTVWLMRQVSLDRPVAVKIVRPHELVSEVGARLIREAKVLATLDHPAVVRVFDVGRDGENPYMVCEYVKGETLAQRLRREPPLTPLQAVKIASNILLGLKAAHRHGIIHRDLKPANIFLDAASKPKIGDFGLAKAQDLPSGTAQGRILGTPAYMSPEQCRGFSATPSSDLYAVGAILFELVTGVRPFPGPSVLDFLTQHTDLPAPRARFRNELVPSALDEVIGKALKKNPDDRPKSAAQFRTILQEIQGALSGASTTKRVKVEIVQGAILASRYRLVRKLGSGRMSQVWLATDELREERVALKVLPPELWRDPEARANLIREANLTLRLSHESIIRTHNVESGVCPFLVMEFVDGHSLAENGGPLTLWDAAKVIEQVATALDYAHEREVIHRDVKPANIIVSRANGQIRDAKLADFGVAASAASLVSQPGTPAIGTLSFMSPEQRACRGVDRRTDVFALGATLHQLVTGCEPPEPGAPEVASPQLPGPVRAVVTRAMAAKREDRFGSAGELARALRAATQHDAELGRRARRIFLVVLAILASAGWIRSCHLADRLGATGPTVNGATVR